MDSERKKELRNAYKSKPAIGGIYYILCSGNQRKWLRSTVNMESSKSRFEFSIKTGGAPEPAMQQEWLQYGTESFSFVVLEELQQKEIQTPREFRADIDTLYEMWLEKMEQGELK